MAEQRPVVLVFEDLHWADDTLLDFVDELVDWLTDVPLLVVSTARPELLERRPGWGGGKLDATTLALTPLSDDQTALLLGHLLGRPVLEAASQQLLLERAGGNPLYAEQFAELYLERGSAEELPLPETLQGIIAARLDGLSTTEKSLLQDSAVVGKVFWLGALRADDDGMATLHTLERKGLVRRQRRSSVEGESEFAFAHALVRDVAYGQIARADRAERHRHVATWIESLGRPEDHAEMLAYHWQSALELERASGSSDQETTHRARAALSEAGDRAFALNSYSAAERYYTDALELWPGTEGGRAHLLFQRARALHVAADERRRQALEEARDALLAEGDRENAAEAEAFLEQAAWYEGRREDAVAHLQRAEELIADAGASAAKARVLCFGARFRMLDGDYEHSIETARRGLDLAEELSLEELEAHALTTIGSAKNALDVSSGNDELERALELALAIDSPLAANIVNNMSVEASARGDIAATGALMDEAAQLARRFGDADLLRFNRGNRIAITFLLGAWNDAALAAESFIAECASSPHYLESAVRAIRGDIRFARGDASGALDDWHRSVELAREVRDPQTLLPALLHSAAGRVQLGRSAEARALVSEALTVARAHPADAVYLYLVSPHAGTLEMRDELRDVLELAPASPWKTIAAASLESDFAHAAELLATSGSRTREAEVRLAAAELLFEHGRREDGETQLEQALDFYRSVGATFFVDRAEEILAGAQRDSA
jgi:tetratricopeptide (TPR) repeat protein